MNRVTVKVSDIRIPASFARTIPKEEKIEIVKEWYNIYHEDLTLNQIFKKLKSKFIRTKQKIESIIPKKIAEEYGLYNGVMMDEGINLINP